MELKIKTQFNEGDYVWYVDNSRYFYQLSFIRIDGVEVALNKKTVSINYKAIPYASTVCVERIDCPFDNFEKKSLKLFATLDEALARIKQMEEKK